MNSEISQIGSFPRTSPFSTRWGGSVGATPAAQSPSPASVGGQGLYDSFQRSAELGEDGASAIAPATPRPFFARYLENQNVSQPSCTHDNRNVTMAYPSDADADGGRSHDNRNVTMAYPSDADADSGRRPDSGRVTMAYPSDADADSGRPPDSGGRGHCHDGRRGHHGHHHHHRHPNPHGLDGMDNGLFRGSR